MFKGLIVYYYSSNESVIPSEFTVSQVEKMCGDIIEIEDHIEYFDSEKSYIEGGKRLKYKNEFYDIEYRNSGHSDIELISVDWVKNPTKENIEETITISKKEYDELIHDQMGLQSLEEAGVDNGPGCAEANVIMKEGLKEEE